MLEVTMSSYQMEQAVSLPQATQPAPDSASLVQTAKVAEISVQEASPIDDEEFATAKVLPCHTFGRDQPVVRVIHADLE